MPSQQSCCPMIHGFANSRGGRAYIVYTSTCIITASLRFSLLVYQSWALKGGYTFVCNFLTQETAALLREEDHGAGKERRLEENGEAYFHRLQGEP